MIYKVDLKCDRKEGGMNIHSFGDGHGNFSNLPSFSYNVKLNYI